MKTRRILIALTSLAFVVLGSGVAHAGVLSFHPNW